MLEKIKNLWDYHPISDAVVITTNGVITRAEGLSWAKAVP